jgi:ATP:ADP antiporter, AAA family
MSSQAQTIKTWWGNFTKEELKKFALLAIIFGFTIGVYWLLRPLKDAVFMKTVHADNIPYAKWISLLIIVPLGMLYSKLIDMFPRHHVFYALSGIYATLALMFGFFFTHETLGLTNLVTTIVNNEVHSEHALFWGRIIGWAWYVFVESFGSIMVVLFWAFAADTTDPDSAKRGFPIVAFGAQVGGILGPLLATIYGEKLGAGVLTIVAAAGIISIAFMIWYFMSVIPASQLTGYQAKDQGKSSDKQKTGFMEGLRLMLEQPYLLGIFAVISLYEIINTILDYHFKYMAGQQHADPNALLSYLGSFGVYTNGVAFICILLGINNIGRILGLRTALIVLPILMTGIIGFLYMNPTLSVAFWILVFGKALNYALNQPTKEQLYVPTSKDAKYKAKAFIEMFGSRGSKAFGSGINMFKQHLGAETFILFSTGASLGLILVWIYTAVYLGNTHKKAVSENKVVC